MRISVRIATAVVCIASATVLCAQDQALSFQMGDIVLRGANDLRWYRGDKQVGSWGQSWAIASDHQHRLWVGFIQNNAITLRKFTAPAKSQDYVSTTAFEGATIAKIISAGDQLYVLLTAPHNGKELERIIKVMPFSMSTGTFGNETVLKDFNGQPELLLLPPLPAADRFPKQRHELLTHGIWDAVLFGKNQLWVSSQDQILCYLIDERQSATNQAGAAQVEGNGARKKVIHRRDTDLGNPRGIVPYSETQLAMVDCSGSGRLVLIGAMGPVSSATFTEQIDPGVTTTWGWNSVLISKDDIFVSNSNPTVGRVARIDRKTGQLKNTLVSGFPVSEMVEIQ